MGICLSKLCPSAELTEDPATRTISSHHASLAQRKAVSRARLPHELSRYDLRVPDSSRPTTSGPKSRSEKRRPSRQKSTEKSECELALTVPQVLVTPVDGEFAADLKDEMNPSEVDTYSAEKHAAQRDSAFENAPEDLDAEKRRAGADSLWEPGYGAKKWYRASY